MSHFVITGAPGGAPNRLEINDFVKNEKYFSLFIQALRAMQQDNQDDIPSFFSVGKIHGLPYRPWDGTHGSVLFPTWHRPYMALHEQIMQSLAQQIAETYTVDRDAWVEAATKLRHPFWDWALNAVPPDEVIVLQQVTITSPSGNRITVDNPLYHYNFHPIDPSFPRPYSLWNTTIRQATSRNANASDDVNRLKAVLQSAQSDITSSTYNMLTRVHDWSAFSNHNAGDGGSTSNSLEAIHDGIHVDIGGLGHMSNPAVAAFDPIFYLHHCNVDRMLQLWSALNPGVWVTPNNADRGSFTIPAFTRVDENTPLIPFWNGQSSFWTAAGTRDTTTLGYSYPDFNGLDLSNPQATQAAIADRVNNLYGSLVFGSAFSAISTATSALKQAVSSQQVLLAPAASFAAEEQGQDSNDQGVGTGDSASGDQSSGRVFPAPFGRHGLFIKADNQQDTLAASFVAEEQGQDSNDQGVGAGDSGSGDQSSGRIFPAPFDHHNLLINGEKAQDVLAAPEAVSFAAAEQGQDSNDQGVGTGDSASGDQSSGRVSPTPFGRHNLFIKAEDQQDTLAASFAAEEQGQDSNDQGVGAGDSGSGDQPSGRVFPAPFGRHNLFIKAENQQGLLAAPEDASFTAKEQGQDNNDQGVGTGDSASGDQSSGRVFPAPFGRHGLFIKADNQQDTLAASFVAEDQGQDSNDQGVGTGDSGSGDQSSGRVFPAPFGRHNFIIKGDNQQNPEASSVNEEEQGQDSNDQGVGSGDSASGDQSSGRVFPAPSGHNLFIKAENQNPEAASVDAEEQGQDSNDQGVGTGDSASGDQSSGRLFPAPFGHHNLFINGEKPEDLFAVPAATSFAAGDQGQDSNDQGVGSGDSASGDQSSGRVFPAPFGRFIKAENQQNPDAASVNAEEQGQDSNDQGVGSGDSASGDQSSGRVFPAPSGHNLFIKAENQQNPEAASFNAEEQGQDSNDQGVGTGDSASGDQSSGRVFPAPFGRHNLFINGEKPEDLLAAPAATSFAAGDQGQDSNDQGVGSGDSASGDQSSGRVFPTPFGRFIKAENQRNPDAASVNAEEQGQDSNDQGVGTGDSASGDQSSGRVFPAPFGRHNRFIKAENQQDLLAAQTAASFVAEEQGQDSNDQGVGTGDSASGGQSSGRVVPAPFGRFINLATQRVPHTGPEGSPNGPMYDWTCRVAFKNFELSSSFSVLIFLGEVPADPEEWRLSPNYVGSHYGFVNSNANQCENCRSQEDVIVEGFVHLNQALVSRCGLEPNVVELYLTQNLNWRVQKTNGETANLSTLEVSVYLTPLGYPPGAILPVYGERSRRNRITYGRPGGSREL